MTRRLLGIVLLGSATACAKPPSTPTQALAWDQLPPLPAAPGLAGAFAGVSHGALLLAGGANFPGGRPWDGHPKVWHDRIYVLDLASRAWRIADQRLSFPVAYGVSLTWRDKVVCLGGGGRERHFADAFTLELEGDSIRRERLPPLPQPAAFACGAMLGDTVYLAGGLAEPDATQALGATWTLDLAAARPAWHSLPPCPGPERSLAVAAAQDGAFHLFSGIRVEADEDGRPRRVRPYLRDAWRYSPASRRWQRLADLPHPIAGAPSPGIAAGDAHVLVFSGDDGTQDASLQDAHVGFSPLVLAHHTLTDTWRGAGSLPKSLGPDPVHRPEAGLWPPVTTPVVRWVDRVIVPSGEVRPGVRTTRVLVARRAPRGGRFGAPDFAVLVIYLLCLVGIGFYFARREHGTEDFFLGGRRVPWWAAGMSIFGTQLSAITFMAIPAKTYATDWRYFLMSAGIVLMGPIVVYLYLPFFRRLGLTTAYAYLERRFSLAIRWFGSLSFIAFQLGRMSVILFLPALALAAVTGIPVEVCILLMGVLCTIYTVLGGIEAVIWTDVLQVGVLLGGALVALVVVSSRVEGGIGGVFDLAQSASKLRLVDLSWDFTRPVLGVILLGAIFNNLVPYTTDQTVVQRYLTTRDEKRAARAVWTGTLLALPASLLFFGIGTALWAFYRTEPARLDTHGHADQIFPWFIVQELPAGAAGLVIAGVFAAAMSSLDSSMNSIATAVTTDFYRRLRPAAPDARCLALARWITVALGTLATGTALLMAQTEIASLWDTFLALLGLLGGTLGGLFALGILSRRASNGGAVIGALASIAALAWAYLGTDLSSLAYAAVGVVSCFVIGWASSFVLPDHRPREGLTVHGLLHRP